MDSWQGSLLAGQPDVEAAAQLVAAGLLAKSDVTAEVARCGSAATDAWQRSIAQGEPDIAAATQTIAAGILTNADVSSEMHETGRQLALGLASGIEAEQSRALTASAKLAMNTVSAAMKAAQIHSPSRLMRNKVGKMLPAGLALGIEDGAPAVLQAVETLSEAAIACARDEAGSYREIGSQYMENLTFGVESMRDKSIDAIVQAVKADTAAYKAQIDAQTETLVAAKKKQLEAANQVQKEGLQKEIDQLKADAADKKKVYEDAGKQATDAYRSALSAGFADALDLVKSRVSALTGEFQQAHDDLTRQQEAMQSKLSGFGDLFTMDKSGDLSLGKIEQNIEAVKRYDQALTRLAERGVSDEFMQKVTALGVEEGTKFAEKLIGLSRGGFSAYIDAWDEQQRLSKEVASRFYAGQLETLDRDFQGKLNGVLADVPQTMAQLGAQSLQGWAKGLTAQMDGASQDVQSMLSGLITAFGKAGQAPPVMDSGQNGAQRGRKRQHHGCGLRKNHWTGLSDGNADRFGVKTYTYRAKIARKGRNP